MNELASASFFSVTEKTILANRSNQKLHLSDKQEGILGVETPLFQYLKD